MHDTDTETKIKQNVLEILLKTRDEFIDPHDINANVLLIFLIFNRNIYTNSSSWLNNTYCTFFLKNIIINKIRNRHISINAVVFFLLKKSVI